LIIWFTISSDVETSSTIESSKKEYPNKVSAEDHWFSVLLLLQKEKLKIMIDENLLYCLYSLDGFATDCNMNNNSYLKSREELYQFYLANK